MKENRTFGTIKKVMKYIKKYSFLAVLSLLFALVSSMGMLYVPILVGEAVDILSEGTELGIDLAGVFTVLLRAAAVAFVSAAFQWIMGIVNNRIAFNTARDMRNEAFEKLQRLPVGYIDSHLHGDIMSRIVTDIDQLSEGLLLGFSQLFSGMVTILGTIVIMILINPKIAFIVIFMTPLSLFAARFISKRTDSMFKHQAEIKGEQTAFINEMLVNQKVVQSFNRQHHSEEMFDRINAEMKKSSMDAVFYWSVTNPCTRFVNNLVYAFVGVFGALAAVYEGFSVGELTCFLSYASQYTKPFNEISGVVVELQNSLVCASRVFEFMEEKDVCRLPDDGIMLDKVRGSIDIENVCFSYSRDRDFIKNLNLKVMPGQRIAIVGPTGCGKTTIINLLMRFYDIDKGKISVDEVDIRDVSLKSLRSGFGMVLQETWIKTATVKENIRMGRPEASDAEVIEAAKLAHAHDFIERLPDGYDTEISSNSGFLSEGQRQLICIARVMLYSPPMLILDEATSSIDTRTEMKVKQAFDTLMEGKTSFVVAHRLSTIENADVILVMKDGNIIEQGSHKELLKRNGFYSELYCSNKGEEFKN